MSLRNNVERWLIHNNFPFKEINSDEDLFKMTIKNIGAFGNMIFAALFKMTDNRRRMVLLTFLTFASLC